MIANQIRQNLDTSKSFKINSTDMATDFQTFSSQVRTNPSTIHDQ